MEPNKDAEPTLSSCAVMRWEEGLFGYCSDIASLHWQLIVLGKVRHIALEVFLQEFLRNQRHA